MTNQPAREQERSEQRQESQRPDPDAKGKEQGGPGKVRPETQNPTTGANPGGDDAHQGHQGPR